MIETRLAADKGLYAFFFSGLGTLHLPKCQDSLRRVRYSSKRLSEMKRE